MARRVIPPSTGGGGGTIATVSDTTSIDLTITGSNLSGTAIFGTSAGTVAEGSHNHDAAYSVLGHTHANDHVAVTVVDTASIDFTLTGQQITASVLPAGISHNSLSGLTTGDPHTQYMPKSGGTFTGDIIVPAEVYGAGWNASNEAPTKNDVYDKIETLSAGATGYTVGPVIYFISRQPVVSVASDYEWVNMPSAYTEFGGNNIRRKLVDLTDLTEYFFSHELVVAGNATGVIDLEYSTNIAVPSWTSMGGGTLSVANAEWTNTGWQAIPTGAKTLVLLRVVGSNGNGTADPRWTNLSAHFRGVGVTGPQGPAGQGFTDGDKGDITISGTGTVLTIDNDVVTYAKMQNVSATDRVLGRSTAGAGDVEEIPLTAAGRALIDDVDAAAQRTTLGLGTIATQAANNVAITGGAITGITDLVVADGGTGASSASAARSNLGLVIGTDVAAQAHNHNDAAGGGQLTAAAMSGFDISDAIFRVVDNADATKKLAFETSGFTTGTTRTVTFPNSDATVATLANTQTLTNKTLTTPIIGDFTSATHTHANAAGGGVLNQSATHGTPDTDSGTTALHHTLGTGANQAAAGNHTHTKTRHQAVVIGDGVNDITTTTPTPDMHFSSAGTITKWRILGKQSGTIQLDPWKDTYANYPPTVADSIAASAKPNLSAANKNESSTLTGWTTAIAAGDTLRINIDSVTAGLKMITFIIEYSETI